MSRHAGGRPKEKTRCKLGEKIERFAEQKNVPLDVLAENIGVSVPTLYRVITGDTKSPRYEQILKIAKCLKVKPERLMAG